MNKNLFLLFVLFLFPAYVFASVPLKELLQPALLEKLLAEGTITETPSKNEDFLLLPNHKELKEKVNTVQGKLNSPVVVETLNLYPKNASKSWSKEEKRALFNGILALSTLEKLEYFSKTKGKMRVLYEKSVSIDNPKDKNELKDTTVVDLPKELTIYAKQKDTTFGENIYQYDYSVGDELLTIVQKNLNSIRYGIIPVADKNKLYSVIAIIDAKEYLLIYAVSMADISSASLFEKRMKESFMNRSNALMKWFSEKIATR